MKIVKTKVQATTRKLNANWNEHAIEIENLFHEELQKEIDTEILNNVKAAQLKMEGWHEIRLAYPKQVRLPEGWPEEHFQGEVMHYGNYSADTWLFKLHEDAVRFVLEWCCND